MQVQVKKWGNSASIRIPASIMASSALHLDQVLDIRDEGGRIVLEPVSPPAYDLDALLARMKPETFPEDVSFGVPMGDEIW